MAFFKWFLTKEAQKAYAEAGGIPVRTDVMDELSGRAGVRLDEGLPDQASTPASRCSAIAEGASVEQVMALRLNQAVIGELSPAAGAQRRGQGDRGDLHPARPHDGPPRATAGMNRRVSSAPSA